MNKLKKVRGRCVSLHKAEPVIDLPRISPTSDWSVSISEFRLLPSQWASSWSTGHANRIGNQLDLKRHKTAGVAQWNK